MKAVSYVINNHDDFKNSLVDIEKAKPTLKERDVLVKVQTVTLPNLRHLINRIKLPD